MSIKHKIKRIKEIKSIPFGDIKNAVYKYKEYFDYSSASKDYSEIGCLCREMRIVSHTIEKALSLPRVKKGFGKEKIQTLISLLDKFVELGDWEYDSEAFYNTLGIVQKYCECAEEYECDTSFVDLAKYEKWMSEMTVSEYGVEGFENPSAKDIGNMNFYEFAHSRHSLRCYDSKQIGDGVVEKVVELAKTAPSACNRQSTRVFYIKDRDVCKAILEIQGGARGHDVSNLFLVASDMSLYRHFSEQETPYLDSGIFLMNLLYACEYYGLSTCPLIWDDFGKKSELLRKLVNISKKYRIVAVVQVGYAPESGTYAKSKRKNTQDILINI